MRCGFLALLFVVSAYEIPNYLKYGDYHKYSYFSESDRRQSLEEVRQMFTFAYDSYIQYAFPKDELDPIHCTGRGPDYENPSNININDVLGDYVLTLVDSLDTLAIMGNVSEFQNAVNLVINNLSFEKHNTVQVFEASIRVIGGLLSAHLLIVEKPLGDMGFDDYDNELLTLAHDLADRLLPAFEESPTGIPYPRVQLCNGVPKNSSREQCLAGAGTLILEFGLLSHLLDDPVYERHARWSMDRVWSLRSNVTGLLGFTVDVKNGQWLGVMSGLGAGFDSYYEYLLKSFIMFGNEEDLQRFTEFYDVLNYYLRKGRKSCNEGEGTPPLHVNVNMMTGDIVNYWVDSLQAAWAGVQLLYGDVQEAICTHAFFYNVWRRFGALPERFNWQMKVAEVKFYPLRPELTEATYLLYQATKHPFYLHVGRNILHSLNNHTKAQCGYATIHDVLTMELEDRMESFFLSETCKYLYLLFDLDNTVNRDQSNLLFSTEGHLYPILTRTSDNNGAPQHRKSTKLKTLEVPVWSASKILRKLKSLDEISDSCLQNHTCENPAELRQSWGASWLKELPLETRYYQQLEAFVDLS